MHVYATVRKVTTLITSSAGPGTRYDLRSPQVSLHLYILSLQGVGSRAGYVRLNMFKQKSFFFYKSQKPFTVMQYVFFVWRSFV